MNFPHLAALVNYLITVCEWAVPREVAALLLGYGFGTLPVVLVVDGRPRRHLTLADAVPAARDAGPLVREIFTRPDWFYPLHRRLESLAPCVCPSMQEAHGALDAESREFFGQFPCAHCLRQIRITVPA